MSEPFYDPSDRADDDVTREEFDSSLGIDDLDDDHPQWCINAQIKDMLQGGGSNEDHRHVIEFLRSTGLPEGTAKRVHRAIVCAELPPTIDARLIFNEAAPIILTPMIQGLAEGLGVDLETEIGISIGEQPATRFTLARLLNGIAKATGKDPS